MVSRFWRILHRPAAPTDNNNNPSLRHRKKNLKLVSHLVTWPRRITRISPILPSSSILTTKTYSKTPSPRARIAQGGVMGSLRFQKVPITPSRLSRCFTKGNCCLCSKVGKRKEGKGKEVAFEKKFSLSFFFFRVKE